MHILGFDLSTLNNQLKALTLNVYAWIRSYLPNAFVITNNNHTNTNTDDRSNDGPFKCIEIPSPGGFDQLKIKSFGHNIATVGYNIAGYKSPYANLPSNLSDLPSHLVIINTHYFSINYADITIRWGLYESALRYVGWPIVPGFDFSGVIEYASPTSNYKIGDKIFGYTLFGAYSSRIIVPENQIRQIPSNNIISTSDAAALPAVAATALHAIALANAYPNPLITKNKSALIHSAAGGVGTMLIQICKLSGFSPIIAVVGSSHKSQLCYDLGANIVIDKSEYDSSSSLWKALSIANSNHSFAAIFDANGVSTLSQSYDHLSRCGRLITYGFHTNVPHSAYLSPFAWISMIYRVINLPKFDPMNLVLNSRGVLGFNLSFFADEYEIIEAYMKQIIIWVESGVLKVPAVTLFKMEEIARAHELIQSGKSIGKIVIKI